MQKWQDRDWNPSEDEQSQVADLRLLEAGQTLLRLIDQAQLNEMEACGFAPQGATEALTLGEVSRSQGSYQALQLVKAWLLKERDSDSDSQEVDDE